MTILKSTAITPKTILFCKEPMVGVGIVVDDAASVTEDGVLKVKAGTPLAGDLSARATPFVAAVEGNAVGVLLHDVDVTNGNANGTLMIEGYINIDKVDATTLALNTAGVKAAMGKVTFLK